MNAARGGSFGKLAFLIQDSVDTKTTQYDLEVAGAHTAGIEIFGISFGNQIKGAGEAQLISAGK